METEFKTAEIYNSNIGHNLASLHCFLTEKIELLSEVRLLVFSQKILTYSIHEQGGPGFKPGAPN